MICRPRALNEKKSDGEQLRSTNGAPEEESRHVASIEAQEAKALQEYSEAVSWIAQGRMEEAEAKLQKLWHSELIQTSAGKKSAGFSRSILKLRRAIEKNLAPFLSKSGRHSEAIDFYINVCEHEPDNFMAWYSLGIEGWKAFNFVIAREAFLYARALNSDNFSCLEHLASTFFVLGDHGNCLQILAEMLKRKPSCLRCLVLRDEIFRRQPYLRAVSEHLFPSPGSSYSIEYRQQVVAPLDAIAKKLRRDSVSLELDAIVPPDPRNVLTLVDLGDALLSTYEWIKEQPMGLMRPVVWTGVWTFPLTHSIRERVHAEESEGGCMIPPGNAESTQSEGNKVEYVGLLSGGNGMTDSASSENLMGMSNESNSRRESTDILFRTHVYSEI